MKTLLILRHAKAETPQSHQPDFNRVLAPRGLRDSANMGEWLLSAHSVPDLILCSTAARARQTAALVIKDCNFAGRLEMLAELYLAMPAVYIEALHRNAGDSDSVMVVGHNPGLEELLHQLTGKVEVMPTACLAVVKAPIADWRELNIQKHYELAEFIRPREL